MQKILVTGGAGFVGSHLCERLAQDKKNKVYSLDNYFTGCKKNHVPKVTYIKGNTSKISNLIDFKPDILFHLGEYSRVEQSFEDIDRVWEYNINGMYEVLKFVRKHNCKIVYAGSSTKFGDGGAGRSSSPYAWTKSSNTDLLISYSNWFNLKYAITYFYNVYGPREISSGKYATLIALFKQKQKNNDALTVVSPGTQKRNFTHIDDIVEGLILVGEKGIGDNYGIGSKEAYSVLEIAKMFGGDVTMLPERKGNRMDADLITTKTLELGWSQKKSIEEYISNIVK